MFRRNSMFKKKLIQTCIIGICMLMIGPSVANANPHIEVLRCYDENYGPLFEWSCSAGLNGHTDAATIFCSNSDCFFSHKFKALAHGDENKEMVMELTEKTVKQFVDKALFYANNSDEKIKIPNAKVNMLKFISALLRNQFEYADAPWAEYGGLRDLKFKDIIDRDFKKCLESPPEGTWDKKAVCLQLTNVLAKVAIDLELPDCYFVDRYQGQGHVRHAFMIYKDPQDGKFHVLDPVTPSNEFMELSNCLAMFTPDKRFGDRLNAKQYRIINLTNSQGKANGELSSKSLSQLCLDADDIYSVLGESLGLKNPCLISSYVDVDEENKAVTVKAINGETTLPDDFGLALENEIIRPKKLKGCTLVIDKSVKKLKDRQFELVNIGSVDMSSTSIKKISKECFGRCSMLKSVTVPESLEEIEAAAFLTVPSNGFKFPGFEKTAFAKNSRYDTGDAFVEGQRKKLREDWESGIFGGNLGAAVNMSDTAELVRENYWKLHNSIQRGDSDSLIIGMNMDYIDSTYLRLLQHLGFDLRRVIVSEDVLEIKPETFQGMYFESLVFEGDQNSCPLTLQRNGSYLYINTFYCTVIDRLEVKRKISLPEDIKSCNNIFRSTKIGELYLDPINFEFTHWSAFASGKYDDVSKIGRLANSEYFKGLLVPYIEFNGNTLLIKGNFDQLPLKFNVSNPRKRAIVDPTAHFDNQPALSDSFLAFLQICYPEEFKIVNTIKIDSSIWCSSRYDLENKWLGYLLLPFGINLTDLPDNIRTIDLSEAKQFIYNGNVRIHFPKRPMTLRLENTLSLEHLTDIIRTACTRVEFTDYKNEDVQKTFGVKLMDNGYDVVINYDKRGSSSPYQTMEAIRLIFDKKFNRVRFVQSSDVNRNIMCLHPRKRLFDGWRVVDFRQCKSMMLNGKYFEYFISNDEPYDWDLRKFRDIFKKRDVQHNEIYLIFDDLNNICQQQEFYRLLDKYFKIVMPQEILEKLVGGCPGGNLRQKLYFFCQENNIVANFMSLEEFSTLSI